MDLLQSWGPQAASLIVLGFIVWIFLKHLQDENRNNREVFGQLHQINTRNIEALDRNSETHSTMTEVLRTFRRDMRRDPSDRSSGD